MAKRVQRPGFIIYYETMDCLEEYTLEELGRYIRAAARYARFGTEPVFEDRGLRALWIRTKRDLDRDDETYQAKCQTNRYNAYVAAEKRRFKREHSGEGEPKVGKDYFEKEDWIELVDNTAASERIQSDTAASERIQSDTAASEAYPITTTTSTEPKLEHQYQHNHNENPNHNTKERQSKKGDRGEQTPEELQTEWRNAGDNNKRMEIANQLYKLGYDIDHTSGEIIKRAQHMERKQNLQL